VAEAKPVPLMRVPAHLGAWLRSPLFWGLRLSPVDTAPSLSRLRHGLYLKARCICQGLPVFPGNHRTVPGRDDNRQRSCPSPPLPPGKAVLAEGASPPGLADGECSSTWHEHALCPPFPGRDPLHPFNPVCDPAPV